MLFLPLKFVFPSSSPKTVSFTLFWFWCWYGEATCRHVQREGCELKSSILDLECAIAVANSKVIPWWSLCLRVILKSKCSWWWYQSPNTIFRDWMASFALLLLFCNSETYYYYYYYHYYYCLVVLVIIIRLRYKYLVFWKWLLISWVQTSWICWGKLLFVFW